MLRHLSSSLLIILAAIFASSCSDERQSAAILDAIPAEATAVSFVNLPRAAQAGIDLSQYPSLSACRGMDIVALVSFADGQTIAIAEAPGPDSIAASGFAPADAAGGSFQAYSGPDGRSMIVNPSKGLAYISSLSAVRAVERVGEIADAASARSMSSFKGIENFIGKASADAPLYGVVARRSIGGYSPDPKEPQSEQWVTFSASGDAREAALTASLIEGSGEPVEIKGLQTIDTDFLRYMPSSINVALAAGLTPEMDWDAAFSMLTLLPTGDVARNMAIILPYLKELNGTMAVGMSLSPESDGAMTAFAMARLSRDNIDELIGKVTSLASLADIPVSSSGAMTQLTIPGFGPLFMGELDGNLAVATFPLAAGQSNELTPVFQGHDAAASISVPADSRFMGYSLPDQDGSARMALDGSTLSLRLSLGEGRYKAFPVIFDKIIK